MNIIFFAIILSILNVRSNTDCVEYWKYFEILIIMWMVRKFGSYTFKVLRNQKSSPFYGSKNVDARLMLITGIILCLTFYDMANQYL